MNSTITFGPSGLGTVFRHKGEQLNLTQLCGFSCAEISPEAESFLRLAELGTSTGRLQPADFHIVEVAADGDRVRLAWQVGGVALLWESEWTVCAETAVVSRKDILRNNTDEPVVVTHCRTRFVFPPARWEVYAQQSRWCNESQGRWQGLHAGSLKFGCLPGRSTEGGTPYCCLRPLDGEEGLAFHVLPVGNWSIEVRARAVQNGLPYAILGLGMAGDDLWVELAPGESLELPEILIQPLPSGKPHLAAPALHGYVQERFFSNARIELPVVYNTWFDQFEVLEPQRLGRQLEAAREVGCEVFVVDAGWYGPQADDWWSQAGDWRERKTAAFRGEMRKFADEVRAAELGFGLWMEPERFGDDVPVVKDNPEWFLPAESEFSRIDLTNPAAYDYLRDEISRLVETYELAWMKVDFNFRLGLDPSGAELAGYSAAWYRLLDEIRRKHPETIFEGCSSGAMRLDLNTLQHFDGHFLSDTVDPVDVLRILQGSLLRLPPGQLIKWLVLRSAGQAVPTYTKSLADSPAAMLAPCGAIWEPARTVDLDFAAATALPGVFGLSGDLEGMPAEARQKIIRHVEFFKHWRKFMRGSVAHLLTPPELKENRQGWVAVQLTNPSSTDSLLFAYRLDQSAASRRFVLRGLDAGKEYRVSPHIPGDGEVETCRGSDLLRDGLKVDLPARFRAAVYTLET